MPGDHYSQQLPENRRQKRALLFAHDSTGLGHLIRLARIAEEIQGPFAALVVTSLRQAVWLVPNCCEVLRLPGWDSMSPNRAQYWNRSLWLEDLPERSTNLRENLLLGVFRAFNPDAVFVDYLPFGQHSELTPALQESRAKKYYILRGIVDLSDYPKICGSASSAIAEAYDRILVAADKRIVDVASEYSFNSDAIAKVMYVGYVAPKSVDREKVRRSKNIHGDRKWVVCSGGAGRGAERLLKHCVEIAEAMPEADFDIVFGPQSKVELTECRSVPSNCCVARECFNLSDFHASADVVVSAGGYNSTLEAATGGAYLIVHPSQSGSDNEQLTQAVRLTRYYPTTLLESVGQLETTIRERISLSAQRMRPELRLDTGGTRRIKEILFSDFQTERDYF